MKKISLLGLLLLLLAGTSMATTHTIQVGVSGGLTFSPNSITTVVVGDVIHWVWVSGSHTTTSISVPNGAATWSSNITSGTTSFDYTVTQPGTYDYQCNPHSGSGMTGSFVASVSTPVIDKTSEVYSSFQFTSNPVADQLGMKFSSSQSFKANLLVFDANGKEKMNKKLEVLSGDNNFSFPASNFPKGVYYLVLMDGETSFISKKFVKE